MAFLFLLSSCLFTLAALGIPTDPPPTPPPVPTITLPDPPPLAAPAPVDEVVRTFVDHVASSPAFDKEAAAFVRRQYDERRAAASRDLAAFPDSALAVLSEDFRRALDAATAEDPTAAAAQFAALARGNDPYLSVNAAFFAAQAMIDLDNVRDAHDLLHDVLTRHAPATRYTTHGEHLLFLLAYAQVHTLQYDAAQAGFTHFLANCPDAPERFTVTARQILTELERRQPGRLGDVHDLMDYSRRELRLARTDDEMRARQAEAVRLLDQLIEEAEENEKNGQCNNQGDSKKNQRRSQAQRNRQPQRNAQQSELREAGGADKQLEEARRARPGESWGKMPAREREQILQALQKQFPSQYRDLVEQYYRQLSRESSRP